MKFLQVQIWMYGKGDPKVLQAHCEGRINDEAVSKVNRLIDEIALVFENAKRVGK